MVRAARCRVRDLERDQCAARGRHRGQDQSLYRWLWGGIRLARPLPLPDQKTQVPKISRMPQGEKTCRIGQSATVNDVSPQSRWTAEPDPRRPPGDLGGSADDHVRPY
ncbi:hypothetical protein GCM10010317_056550 [Streptomyces mirabilis]|nr:hypothetical protein GCM10010317_056550 [Streptomyces mirabilis]